MGLKSGFGKAGNMNGPRTSKNGKSVRSGFGGGATGPNKVKGYSGGRGNRLTERPGGSSGKKNPPRKAHGL